LKTKTNPPPYPKSLFFNFKDGKMHPQEMGFGVQDAELEDTVYCHLPGDAPTRVKGGWGT
jgi:hypothetical protein